MRACRRPRPARPWRETPARCRCRCRRSRRPPAPACPRNPARSCPSLPSSVCLVLGWLKRLSTQRETLGGNAMPEFRELSRSVKGLTVLVTGAASGMGRATARVFAAEGAHVAVTDLSAEATRAVADEIAAKGGAAKAWALDVADRGAIEKIIPEIAGHFGSLDIIVNNAGISVRVGIDDPSY